MIFGRVHPLTHLSAGLGAATAGTQKLRAAMNKLVQLTGDKNFSPCKTSATSCPASGDVDKFTLFGLIYAANKLAGKVPESDKLGAKISGEIAKIPKVGTILGPLLTNLVTDRGGMDTAWSGIGQLVEGSGCDLLNACVFETDPRPKILGFVRDKADDLAKAVEAINKVIEFTGGAVTQAPPGAVTFVSPMTAQQRIAFTVPTRPTVFPPGTVAVRDPVANVFRILAPPL